MHYENIDTALIDAEALPWHPFLPYATDVFIKVLKVDPVRGEWITLLKAPADVKLPKHHHSGTVMVYTISGQWRYLEHDWVAGPGSFVYETAGTQHTPAGDSKGEVITLNIVQGDWSLIGPEGQVLAIENWKTVVKRYLDHCASANIKPVDVTSFSV
ncbi:2,4'-dihydroxyacetophenone dioxygenase family protein [Cupriavidus laharis]|nr:2,4'-dihydroxyacetophenone dioxygenase family protein [Cupriavidus laharis]